MIRLPAVLVGLICWVSTTSQVLRAIDDQSTVKFKIRNFGFNTVTGAFRGVQGTIRYTPENPTATVMDVTVEAKTVNTGINLRDNHLRKEEYFDVKKYPVIRFVSSRITTSSKPGTFFIFGKLTIKNVTRDISFAFTADLQNGGYLFNGEFKINRLDFGLGESSSVSDNLTVILKVFATK